MSYVDDDDSDIEGGGEEVSFTGTSRSKKAKVSDTKIDMVDVSSTMSSASLVTYNNMQSLFTIMIIERYQTMHTCSCF